MDGNINNALSELKHRSTPLLDFNRRGQLVILIALTVIVLILRLILFLISEYGVLILNLVAFALVFFWVTRIVFTEVRMDNKVPLNFVQKRNFILISTASFFILDYVMLVDEIIISPLLVMVLGFFPVIWLFSLLLDKFILGDTFVHFYFKYLFIIVISITALDLIIELVIGLINT